MEMPTGFERKWQSLNQANRKQAVDFIDFLLARQQSESNPKTGIQLGIWKDEPYYVSDDFDAQLDDFKEYM